MLPISDSVNRRNDKQIKEEQMKIDGIKVHDKAVCEPPCPFHAPSDHPLNEAKIHIRVDKAFLVERICEHGIGHDDPDSVAFMKRHGQSWAGVHGCDGCCTGVKI